MGSEPHTKNSTRPDRSHRKLAHRGSREGLVWVSEATVLRVLRAEHLVLPGNPPREPATRAGWPD